MTNRTFRAGRRGIAFTAAAAAAVLAVGGPAGRARHSPRGGRPARTTNVAAACGPESGIPVMG